MRGTYGAFHEKEKTGGKCLRLSDHIEFTCNFPRSRDDGFMQFPIDRLPVPVQLRGSIDLRPAIHDMDPHDLRIDLTESGF